MGGGENQPLTDAEPNISNGSTTETSFQFAQDLRSGNLLQLIVESRLEHPDVKHSFPKSDRGGMGGDELPDNFRPGIGDFVLVQSLAEAELLHERWQQFPGGFPAI